jgi:hypothetical protein
MVAPSVRSAEYLELMDASPGCSDERSESKDAMSARSVERSELKVAPIARSVEHLVSTHAPPGCSDGRLASMAAWSASSDGSKDEPPALPDEKAAH